MVETINGLSLITGLKPVIVLMLGVFLTVWCCYLLGGNK